MTDLLPRQLDTDYSDRTEFLKKLETESFIFEFWNVFWVWILGLQLIYFRYLLGDQNKLSTIIIF